MGRISMDVRKLVVKKINESWSQRKIAKDLSISRRAVQNILIKLRDHNTIEDLPKTSCPALNSARSVNSVGYENVLKRGLLPIYEAP